MRRWTRKHRAALLAIGVYNLVLLFPVLFMGRLISPNDIFYNYAPWSTVRPHVLTAAQNALLNDAAMGWTPMLSLMQSDWRAFHWEPYLASGVSGFGAHGAVTPFALIPALLLPAAWFFTAMILLKLNVAFAFAYLWLREERLGKKGAAVGAVIVAGASVYAVRWLWQLTTATPLYPAALWIARRILNGRRNSTAMMTLIALVYALSFFPAAMVYGAWIVILYLIVESIRMRRFPARGLAAAVLASALALSIAAPFLSTFTTFIGRSGYLEARENVSLAGAYPLSHAAAFIDPERYGNPVNRWQGDPDLGINDNYVSAAIYLGLLTIPLALAGVFRRRARARWFWLSVLAVLGAAMFGAPWIAAGFAELPGVKYSPLSRLGILLPLGAGYLAAAGAAMLRHRFRVIAVAAAALLAFDLGVVAARFHPYLEPREAEVIETPMTRFLGAQQKPFRIAPFFDYLWPNSAELIPAEDIRSHLLSGQDYRRMLQRIDPTSWSGRTTVISFNSLHYDVKDPLNALLGVRWFVEHKAMDILRWGIYSSTIPVSPEAGPLPLIPGTVVERTIRVDDPSFWALDVPVRIDEESAPGAHLEVLLSKGGRVVWSRRFTMGEANVMNKLYVPVRPYAQAGDEVQVRIRSRGLKGGLVKSRDTAGGVLFYGRVTTPVIFDRELPDGRLFRNLAELPRFRPVTSLRKGNDDEFLMAKDVDFSREAVITDDPVFVEPLQPVSARVSLISYEPHRQRLITESPGRFYLASSEKKTADLRVTIDGEPVQVVETDMVFAGVVVPAGRHEIVFSRRLGRGWWPLAIGGTAIWLLVALYESVRSMRRRLSASPPPE